MQGTIVSIQIGLPKVYQHVVEGDDGEDRAWSSGIFKRVVEGPVWLGKTNLTGDGQADLVHHGGSDRALLLYSADHYPWWTQQFGHDIEFGSFGENLSVTGIDEHSVCLGDRWASDEIEIEISQPRLPCFKLARRMSKPGLNVTVMENRKGGWYARTLRTGNVMKGQKLELLERRHPDWTIDRAFDVFIHEKRDSSVLQALVDIPELSQLWQDNLNKRLGRVE